MKTPLDPRHQKRMHLVQQLFASSFTHGNPEEEISEITSALPPSSKWVGGSEFVPSNHPIHAVKLAAASFAELCRT